MRLLVTRPEEDARSFALLLTKAGHEAVIAPLMEVRFHDGPELNLDSYQAVMATSANGVRALERRTTRRDIAVYAVGPQTAETARAAGFAPVINADGDANALVETVASYASPENGALLHAAGAESAGRLKQNLTARGFTVDAPVLYEAAPVSALPQAALDALQAGTLDGVLLFSPRSAKSFATLTNDAGLAETCTRLTAYCISVATASSLGDLPLAHSVVAGEPNQHAMLAALAAP